MTSSNPRKIIHLAEAQNWRCAYCPTTMQPLDRKTGIQHHDTATIDHVIAKGSGGKATWDNEIAACMACNTAKAHFSAMLFWLLMQEHQFSRRRVTRILYRMTKDQRAKLKTRMAKAILGSAAA